MLTLAPGSDLAHVCLEALMFCVCDIVLLHAIRAFFIRSVLTLVLDILCCLLRKPKTVHTLSIWPMSALFLPLLLFFIHRLVFCHFLFFLDHLPRCRVHHICMLIFLLWPVGCNCLIESGLLILDKDLVSISDFKSLEFFSILAHQLLAVGLVKEQL